MAIREAINALICKVEKTNVLIGSMDVLYCSLALFTINYQGYLSVLCFGNTVVLKYYEENVVSVRAAKCFLQAHFRVRSAFLVTYCSEEEVPVCYSQLTVAIIIILPSIFITFVQYRISVP